MLVASVCEKERIITNVKPNQLDKWLDKPGAVVWVDIEGHTEVDLRVLEQEFRFHPLALEDVRNSHQRPKIDLYDHFVFIVFYAIALDAASNRPVLEEVELFVGPNYIITVHDTTIEPLKQAYTRWQTNASGITRDTASLLYAILDALMDEYFPVLDLVSDRLDELEQGVFEKFDTDLLRQTLQLKRDMLALRRVVGPQRDVMNVLLRGEVVLLPNTALHYLQDLYDHSLRIVEMVDSYRDMVTGVMEGYLSVQSNNINVIMQRLTIINLLFLPLAVLTGFFGMNFTLIPFDSPYLLEAALAGMVLFPTGLFVWLRRQGWG